MTLNPVILLSDARGADSFQLLLVTWVCQQQFLQGPDTCCEGSAAEKLCFSEPFLSTTELMIESLPLLALCITLWDGEEAIL